MAQRIVDHTISIDEIEKKEKSSGQKQTKPDQAKAEKKQASPLKVKKTKKKRGIKYKQSRQFVDKTKIYSVNEAIKLLKKMSFAKFNEAIEAHIVLGIDSTKKAHNIKFSLDLPNAKEKVEIKNQPKHAAIHQKIGALKSKEDHLSQNISALVNGIRKHKPGKLKQKLIRKIYLCTTMSPSVRIPTQLDAKS